MGLGLTGDAVVRWAAGVGADVVVVEDRPDVVDPVRRATAEGLGATLVATPGDPDSAAALLTGVDLLVPSPGVPGGHPFLAAAHRAGVVVRSEVDLGAELLAARGRTLVAVTGTNGKTTVTELTVAMLEASGVPAVAAGNIGAPLLDEATRDRLHVVVAEVSSFQLATVTAAFVPRAAAITNVAADHLDWHGTFDAYAGAKARIFAHQGPGDVLVHDADDPVVTAMAAGAPGRTQPISVLPGATTGFRVEGGRRLVGADGTVLARVDDLTATAPHDLANALAAAALALEVGGTPTGVGRGLRGFVRGAHRLQPVAEADGITWVDDSKATNVHATLAAVRSFPRVVLLAGGRNKGLDLSGLRSVADHLVGVVAIGESADEVVAAFAGVVPVETASSMDDAVARAAAVAGPGDVVLLSPACASFDWYGSYAERGADFSRAVQARVGVTS